jgi:hypothetical protein
MSEKLLPERKADLAFAIAQGASLRKWAEANGVPKTTAYRWAEDPEVQACANTIRRRALERGVGISSRRVAWAWRGIVKLAESADSESVRLSALRAIYSKRRRVIVSRRRPGRRAKANHSSVVSARTGPPTPPERRRQIRTLREYTP